MFVRSPTRLKIFPSSRLHGAVKKFAVSTAALAFALTSAAAGPAPTPSNFSQTTAGAVSSTVPDGVCGISATVTGGGGATNVAAAGATGGNGGPGAVIGATFKALPLQAVTGNVGDGGKVSTTVNGVASGGAGTAAGGNGGIINSTGTDSFPGTYHRGGGGGGAAHQNTPTGNGGAGGFTGIAAGTAAAGSNGAAGNPAQTGGGQGGQVAAGGTGGVNSGSATYNGFAGAGIGTGTGGNGGPDIDIDSGGGGGGGYTGGGGGSSTISTARTGGGGGGGSSFLVATSPTVGAPAPTSITGASATVGGPGAAGATGSNVGTAGAVVMNWVLCNYTLSIAKSASPTTVNAGAKTVWTVSVTNSGPDPMTRGDTVTLTDTLPAPVAGVAPAYKVLTISSAGGSNTDMASGAITCTGLAIGSSMPASTVCSRPYSAPSAPGAPSGGTRGLNSGETLTITYEQIFPNTAACQTVTNPVSTADRTATRNASANVTLNCYDLAVTKTASPATASIGVPTTWTIVVTNNGPADMMGPNDTATNGLTVTDTAPTTNVGLPTSFTSSGPLASCTYTSPTISCPAGLASGQTQTFTFQQTLNNGVAVGTLISNTASVSDPKTGDANDSSTASVSVAQPSVQITKTSVGAGGTFTFNGTNGYGSDTITTPVGGGTTAGVTKTLAAIGTATTVTETIPAGWIAALTSCTGTPAANYSFNTGTGALAFNATATSTGNQIKCTITNTKLPTVQIRKISTGAVGTFSFSGDNGFGIDSITTVTAGVGVSGIVKTLAADSTPTTLTETLTSSFVATAGTCTGTAAGNVTFNPTATSSTATIALNATATAPGNVLVCTYTNAATNPVLTITKTYSTGATPVVVGQTVTYTYTVANTGNVTMTNVQVKDMHGTPAVQVSLGAGGITTETLTISGPLGAGASPDTTANDGIWSTLAPGATVTFTWTHTVTQAEIDNG